MEEGTHSAEAASLVMPGSRNGENASEAEAVPLSGTENPPVDIENPNANCLWISPSGSVLEKSRETSEEDFFKITLAHTADNQIFAYNERCRDIVKEENQLINNRMTWFLQFQGFLFLSASGFAMKSDPIFRIIVAWPGLISGFRFLIALRAADHSIIMMENNMKIISRKHEGVPFYPVNGERSYWKKFDPKRWVIFLIVQAWGGIMAYSIAILVIQAQENGIKSFFLA